MKYNLRKLSIIVIEMIFIMGLFFSYNFGYLDSSKANTYAQTEKPFGIKISGTYENITIDNLPGSWNDWSWAENQVWCSGLGTLANPYVIQGHTLELVNFGVGIRISNSHDIHFIIENCTFIWGGGIQMGSDTGILLINSTMGIINNNSFNGANAGLTVNLSEDLIITNNIINPNYGGITLIQSNSTEISDNIVYSAENAIYLYDSENNNVNNNTVYNSEYGIYISNSESNDVLGNIANDNNIAGIYLAFSDDHNITENTASGNNNGIFLEDDCDNNTIVNNNFINNNVGIEIYYSDFNSIKGNNASNNNGDGIIVEASANNTISGNIVNNNINYGITIHTDSEDNNITCNTIYNNSAHGIHLDSSEYNLLSDNTVYNNSMSGIVLENAADYNNITENSIYNNNYNGIRLDDSYNLYVWDNDIYQNGMSGINATICDIDVFYGNVIRDNVDTGIVVSSSTNMFFYENFFLRNGNHAVNSSGCYWNSTTIGNYWDNYTGTDTNPKDGIGDSPHDFGTGLDYLPIVDNGGPTITINSPAVGDIFSEIAPEFNITINDDRLYYMWYSFDGGLHNYTFTEFSDIIDQAVWDSVPDGTIVLTFYANDKAENIGSAEVSILKNPVGSRGLDPGVIAAIVVVSVAGGLIVIGVAYMYLQKRKNPA